MGCLKAISWFLCLFTSVFGGAMTGPVFTNHHLPRHKEKTAIAALDLQLNVPKLTRTAQELMAEKEVPGMTVLVVAGQKILFQQSWGVDHLEARRPFTKESSVRLASATKFLTSLLALSLAEDGVISLQAPVGALFPEAPDAWRDIPLWRFLNHTSGLQRFLNFPEFENLTREEKAAFSFRQAFEILKKLPLDFEPGSNWRYQQSAYAMFAMMVTEKTGMNWDALLNDHLFRPAGLLATGFGDSLGIHPMSYLEKDGTLAASDYYYPRAFSMGGGYNSTSQDMAQLFMALNGQKIVSTPFLKEQIFEKKMLQPLGSEFYGPATIVKQFGDVKTIGHSGGGGLADIRYAPDVAVGIAVFSNRPSSGVAIQLTDAIASELFGEPKKQ